MLPENQDKHYAALSSRGPLFFLTFSQRHRVKEQSPIPEEEAFVKACLFFICYVMYRTWEFLLTIFLPSPVNTLVPVLGGLLCTVHLNLKMAAEVKVKKDAFEQGNPTAVENQNALAEGIMQIFKPAVEELDDKVLSVRYSWVKYSFTWDTAANSWSVREISLYYREGRLIGLFEGRSLRI